MKTLKEVCAYIRVSTGKQEELSPDSQLRLIKEYAQSHDMLLTHVYMEEHGISGKSSDKRPAFQEMIATCKDKSHPYDAILVWKFSRFARNIDESTYYKSILRKKCNVDVVSISEPIIDGMYGRLIEMVIEWSDEFYLYNLSGEVMRGMSENARRGGYNSNVPLGYIKKSGKNEIPQIDPAGADIVKQIFNMYTIQKLPMSEIASKLNAAGIRTKRGGRFETRTIGYIIDNPFYIGKIRWNYYDRKKNTRKEQSDVIIADGKHTPIITDEQFAEAQQLRAASRRKGGYGKKRPAASAGHWLSGMIECSHCHCHLGFNKNKASTYAFSCWKHAKGMCDTSNYLNKDFAENEVIHAIQDLFQKDCFVEYEEIINPSDDLEEQRIVDELHSLDAKMKRIKEAYINEIDDLEEYQANKKMLLKRKAELERKLNTKLGHSKRTLQRQIDPNAVLAILQDASVPTEQKATAVREIFDHFEWDNATRSFWATLAKDIRVQ